MIKRILLRHAGHLGLMNATSQEAFRNAHVRRRAQLCAADCAAHVLSICEQDPDWAGDERARRAIVAARQLARGEVVAASAKNDIRAACRYLDDTHDDIAPGDHAAFSALGAIGGSLVLAMTAALDAMGNDAARETEERWQFERLIAWLSDPEPDDWPLPDAPVTDKAA